MKVDITEKHKTKTRRYYTLPDIINQCVKHNKISIYRLNWENENGQIAIQWRQVYSLRKGN